MTGKEAEIQKLLEPIFSRSNYHLVELKLRGKLNNQVLSIVVDTDTGITMQQITDLSREIEDILDMHDPIEGKYRLDISSPGIDRPLTEIWQFRKNVNRQLKVRYTQEDEQREVTGTLTEVSENYIVLQTKKEQMTLPIQNIVKAQIMLKW
ncbi:MAG: ribosome maturation factor RimP [Calditrichia bacterium]